MSPRCPADCLPRATLASIRAGAPWIMDRSDCPRISLRAYRFSEIHPECVGFQLRHEAFGRLAPRRHRFGVLRRLAHVLGRILAFPPPHRPRLQNPPTIGEAAVVRRLSPRRG